MATNKEGKFQLNKKLLVYIPNITYICTSFVH